MNPAAYHAVVATRLVAMPALAAATAGWWRVEITIRRAVATASIGLSLILIATSAPAVILYGTGDPTANTTTPTGALANSGWQHEGRFGNFLGTAIAANYFITAKHIGGSVGQSFVLNSVVYTTPQYFQTLRATFRFGRFPEHFRLMRASTAAILAAR